MRHLRHLAAAVLVTVAAGTLTWGGMAPAGSATCAGTGGVSVVVDFKGLGGGVQSVCDAAGGGKKATALFTGNGFELTYAQRTPGFVCRVEAKPASDPCVNTSPANAYWGLWWSDGKSGKWTYSSLGAASLTIPAGGSVAFAWDGVEGPASPGVVPPKQAASPTPAPTPTPTAEPTPKPTPSPSPEPTRTPNPEPSAPASETPTSAVPTPTPTDPPTTTATPSVSASATPTPTPSEPASESTEAAPTAAPDQTEPTAGSVDGGGLPPWVPVGVIVLLFGAAAAFVVRRRRT